MRVGTSFASRYNISAIKDHPHACGDKYQLIHRLLTVSGSSPCVWGQVDLDIWYQFDSRIIPMRVGTSENLYFFSVLPRGSSPCVWGQVISSKFKRDTHRIIPMRVGTRIL